LENVAERLEQCLFTFTAQDEVSIMSEVFLKVICRIGAMHNDDATFTLHHLSHSECRFTHSSETHFGEIVEIIIVDDDNPGCVLSDVRKDFIFTQGEHAVEERHRVSRLSHNACRVRCPE